MKSAAEIDRLLNEHKSLIENEVRKHTHLPAAAVRVEAYDLARKAALDYDKNQGTSFSTHLTNRLKKLSRMSTQFGSLVRLPEKQQFRLQHVNRIKTHLEGEFGRQPTVDELADASGFGQKTVAKLLTFSKPVFSADDALPTAPNFNLGPVSNEWAHYVYHDLPPTDKLIFQQYYGFGGVKTTDVGVIARKLKLTESHVRNRLRLIESKVKEAVNIKI